MRKRCFPSAAQQPSGWIKPADLEEVSTKWTLSSGWNEDDLHTQARLWGKSTFKLQLEPDSSEDLFTV